MAAYMNALDEDPEAAEDLEIPSFEEFTAMNLDTMPPAERKSVEQAMDQVTAFIKQFESPMDMIASLSGELPPPPPPQ